MFTKIRMSLPKKLIIIGVVTCISGVALGWGFLPKFVQNKIAQSKMLFPNSEVRKIWEKLPFPVHFNVYVFNVTNFEAVHEGEVPVVEEIGPFVYDEWKEKVDVVDDDINDSAFYHMKNTWIFNQDLSACLTGDETVYVPNPALLGMLLKAERDRPVMLGILNKAVKSIFNDPSTIFMKTTVKRLLFDGNYLNCTDEDFPASAVCGILKRQLNETFPEVEPGLYSFSFFGRKNGSAEQEKFEVSRGTADVSTVGMVKSLNGKSELKIWAGSPCNDIVGTDGTIFPPFLYRDQSLYLYSTPICRSMRAEYEKISSYKGIPTFRYTADFGDAAKNHYEKCFCTRQGSCLKKGVIDMSPCQGVPVIASLPHFYKADGEYRNGVHGLWPRKEDHGIEIDIEPLTGTPLRGRTRLQLSFPVHPIHRINMTQRLPNVVLPILWIEEAVDLKEYIIEEMENKLFNLLRIFDIGKWVTTVVGAGVATTGTVLNFINPFSSGKMDLSF